MEIDKKDNGMKIIWLKVPILGQMDKDLKDNIKKINTMDMEL